MSTSLQLYVPAMRRDSTTSHSPINDSKALQCVHPASYARPNLNSDQITQPCKASNIIKSTIGYIIILSVVLFITATTSIIYFGYRQYKLVIKPAISSRNFVWAGKTIPIPHLTGHPDRDAIPKSMNTTPGSLSAQIPSRTNIQESFEKYQDAALHWIQNNYPNTPWRVAGSITVLRALMEYKPIFTLALLICIHLARVSSQAQTKRILSLEKEMQSLREKNSKLEKIAASKGDEDWDVLEKND